MSDVTPPHHNFPVSLLLYSYKYTVHYVALALLHCPFLCPLLGFPHFLHVGVFLFLLGTGSKHKFDENAIDRAINVKFKSVSFPHSYQDTIFGVTTKQHKHSYANDTNSN